VQALDRRRQEALNVPLQSRNQIIMFCKTTSEENRSNAAFSVKGKDQKENRGPPKKTPSNYGGKYSEPVLYLVVEFGPGRLRGDGPLVVVEVRLQALKLPAQRIKLAVAWAGGKANMS
jgi:hypothetical protein